MLNFPADPTSQIPANTFSPTTTPEASSNGATYYFSAGRWATANVYDSSQFMGVPAIIKATAPTAREDGDGLEEGDFWWDTTGNVLYIRLNGGWTSVLVSISGNTSNTSVRSVIAPSSPTTREDGSPLQPGDLWWEDASGSGGNGSLYIWSGTEWVDTSITNGGTAGSGDALALISNTAPTNQADGSPLEEGNLWWDSTPNASNLYVYYDDGNGAQWVETSLAESTATAALATANAADTKADSAISMANSADTKADSAILTANTASADATSALSSSSSALSASNVAFTTANLAIDYANEAIAKGDSAIEKAGEALSIAVLAQDIASIARSLAEQNEIAIQDALSRIADLEAN